MYIHAWIELLKNGFVMIFVRERYATGGGGMGGGKGGGRGGGRGGSGREGG